VEQVSQFRYFRQLNIRRRILHKRDLEKNWDGEECIYGKNKLFTGKMNLEPKKRIMKCLSKVTKNQIMYHGNGDSNQ